MYEEEINIAINIIDNNIVKLTKEFAYGQQQSTEELQAKIDVLEKIKAQVNLGDLAFAKKVIQKHKKGAL